MTRSRVIGIAPALIAVAWVASIVSGCGHHAPTNVPMQDVGRWRVGASNDPDPPLVGDNSITIVAHDSSGAPMRGSVDVMVSMPAMGSMPRMESRGNVKPAGAGVFRARYGLAMGGEWDVTVRLHPEGEPPIEARYRVSTSIRGLSMVEATPAASAAPDAVPTPPAADSSGDELGVVTVDAARRQSLGIRTAPAQVRDLATTLRVPGRVAYDEAHQAEVTLKFAGFVRTLATRVTGQAVRRGEVLFTAYSPELWSAEQEYLEALRAADASHGTPALAGSATSIADAARERLTLWDIAPQDLDSLERAGRPLPATPIRSPLSGIVVEKSIVEGSAFTAGQVLYRLARLDPIWVIASVPQQSAGIVRPGMAARIGDPYGGGAARQGQVSFVYPSLDSTTRTAEVRISLPNPGHRLQPGTYVDVEVITPAMKRLAVPESAVLPTGERALVFVDLGDGRLVPREVQLGVRAGGYYEIQGGLREGEVVVTSGNFLIASESKLRSAARKW